MYSDVSGGQLDERWGIAEAWFTFVTLTFQCTLHLVRNDVSSCNVTLYRVKVKQNNGYPVYETTQTLHNLDLPVTRRLTVQRVFPAVFSATHEYMPRSPASTSCMMSCDPPRSSDVTRMRTVSSTSALPLNLCFTRDLNLDLSKASRLLPLDVEFCNNSYEYLHV